MDRYVQRSEALLDDPSQVELGEPGQRREVAVEERQPVVVVLQVQRLAHSRGQLIDEAELAVVVAGLHPVEDRRVQPQTERSPGFLDDVETEVETGAAHDKFDLGFVDELLVLDHIGGQDSVDRHQFVADHEACGRGSTAGHHFEDRRIRHGNAASVGAHPATTNALLT